MDSYDIQSAGHKDTLKKLAKTSLKLDQLIDLGDVDGAQKTQKMYDSLMKSGKFTAAQNKAESGEAVDSISEIVMICEKDGFIPRYYTDGPQDKVDRVLQDLQEYTHSLVTEETNIGNLIENAIKYTNAPGDITITVVPAEDRVVFSVADTGIGIPSSEQKNIFNDFEDELADKDNELLENLTDYMKAGE